MQFDAMAMDTISVDSGTKASIISHGSGTESGTMSKKSFTPRGDDEHRLMQSIVAFSHKAAQGLWCTLFKGEKQRSKGMVLMDKEFENFIVLSGNELETKEVVCPLVCIDDVFSLEDIGQATFPRAVLSQLQPKEMSGLLMVHYQMPDEKQKRRILFLEESAEARDTFICALRLLRDYAAAKSDKTPRSEASDIFQMYMEDRNLPVPSIPSTPGSGDVSLRESNEFSIPSTPHSKESYKLVYC
jgi:hypothetical protein